MNHDDEIAALRQHFDKRGLDVAESLSVMATLAGVHVGLAAPDEDGARQRVDIVAGWIHEAASRIVRSLRGQSGARLQ